jgi:hypothetical protein
VNTLPVFWDSENRELRRVLAPKREEETRARRTLHDEEF